MLVMETKNKEHASQSISRSVGTRVEKVLLCMRSFVSSVSICIQHHPDISSLVLGGFNCVLTVSYLSIVWRYGGGGVKWGNKQAN